MAAHVQAIEGLEVKVISFRAAPYPTLYNNHAGVLIRQTAVLVGSTRLCQIYQLESVQDPGGCPD
jgi:hypothetical protein